MTSAASEAAAGLSPAAARAEGAGKAALPEGARRKADGDEDELTLKSVAQTVRVDIRKLDHLMNIVGELGIARAGLQQILDRVKPTARRSSSRASCTTSCARLSRRLDELQAGILEVRMVPLGQVFDKLSRVVRKISRDAGKEIRLTITGADTELDKLIVEELSDPLMHVMRNCIDHGIERPEVRRARRQARGRAPSASAPSSAAITSSSRSRTTAPGSTRRSWCARRSSAASSARTRRAS